MTITLSSRFPLAARSDTLPARARAGFTLIELLAVMGIIIVMSLFAVNGFGDLDPDGLDPIENYTPRHAARSNATAIGLTLAALTWAAIGIAGIILAVC